VDGLFDFICLGDVIDVGRSSIVVVCSVDGTDVIPNVGGTFGLFKSKHLKTPVTWPLRLPGGCPV
jgi:hypothetical protein